MRSLVLYVFLILQYLYCFLGISSAQEWQEIKSEHFTVYFIQDEKFAKDVLNKAEVYYKDIAGDLGYPRYSGFWTWQNRVKIYIYPDHKTFLKATGQPDWSLGMADYKKKCIISYAWSSEFLDSLLPHEMGHLIFRDFVGFKGEVPLWLDEGVAQRQEPLKRKNIKAVAKKLFESNMLFALKDMMLLDVRKMKNEQIIYVRSLPSKEGKDDILFLGGEKLVHTYYIQAASLVSFLIEKYGTDSFTYFCRQLRDGKSLEEALKFAYSAQIPDLNILEKKWTQYLKED